MCKVNRMILNFSVFKQNVEKDHQISKDFHELGNKGH